MLKKMRKSVLGLLIIVVILAGIGVYYYFDTVSAGSFNNGDISFNYPSNFTLSKSPVGAENSSGYFVCALNSPANDSAIVIYKIPLKSTQNITNETQSTTPTNNTNDSLTNNTTNTNTTVITQTVQVEVDNLQVYLDGVISRGGTTENVTKNNYTYYVSTDLNSGLVSYDSSSRIGNVKIGSVNETAIVSDGSYFYVIELINGNSNQGASDAYNMIVNSFKILG